MRNSEAVTPSHYTKLYQLIPANVSYTVAWIDDMSASPAVFICRTHFLKIKGNGPKALRKLITDIKDIGFFTEVYQWEE